MESNEKYVGNKVKTDVTFRSDFIPELDGHCYQI